ncbi:MAG TPA: helix-turn-helix transcriptional regulator [Planctomycetia bacterium]|nr:helix-turn-helix transcriptional regulator [Planctomycetia bacterium]
MNSEKRKRLEAAGWKVGDAADFLGLSSEEAKLVDLRVSLAQAIRLCREAKGLTQAELAERMNSSQSRVAKAESAASGVSLDLMFTGLFAAGGSLADVKTGPPRKRRVKA